VLSNVVDPARVTEMFMSYPTPRFVEEYGAEIASQRPDRILLDTPFEDSPMRDVMEEHLTKLENEIADHYRFTGMEDGWRVWRHRAPLRD
jgi:hypothetical protein